MDIEILSHFVAVADSGTFGGGAEVAHLSQSAMSRSVARLEADLGQKLFVRTGRQTTLTELGARILESARQLIADATAAENLVASVSRLQAGSLQVAALPVLTSTPLTDVISRFIGRFPGVRLYVLDGRDADGVEALVANGTCELGLTTQGSADPGLSTLALGKQELGVAFQGERSDKEGAPLPRSSLMRLEWVCTPPGSPLSTVLHEVLSHANHAPIVAVTTDHAELIPSLVREGAGVALVPIENAGPTSSSPQLTIHRVNPPILRDVVLVERKASKHSQHAIHFRDALIEHIGTVRQTV